jgi:hypothetical protein
MYLDSYNFSDYQYMLPVHRANNLASFMFQLSRNPGTLNHIKPKGSVQACIKIALLLLYQNVQGARQCPPDTDTVCYETLLLENFTEIVDTFNCR